MNKQYLQEVQEDILRHLADAPLTISDLTERLQRPYATVQQAHKILRDEGKIIAFDRKMRGARYTLGANNGPKSIVPYVKFGPNSYKMTAFAGTKNIPDIGKEAGEKIIKAWANIAITAERLNNGVPNEVLVKRLKAQQLELAKARTALEGLTFLVNQMIDQPKFWDINALSQFPDDESWDEEFKTRILEVYNHFYPDPTTKE